MKVAIQQNLSQIKDYLEDMGCQVSTLRDNNINFNAFDAIVVTGQDDDIMGIEDTLTNAIVIEASGLTPQEVYNQIQRMER